MKYMSMNTYIAIDSAAESCYVYIIVLFYLLGALSST